MVDHLTQIAFDPGTSRGLRIAHALQDHGFELRVQRRRIVAESSLVGAQEAKAILRAAGFEDREYQVFLEYVRQWGIL
jgi:hypothetical protein